MRPGGQTMTAASSITRHEHRTMQHTLGSVGVILLALAAPLFAQQPPAKEKPKFLVKIDQVRVGFRAYANDATGQFKVGMWTPVYVDVIAGEKGVPVKDLASPPYLQFEC